ncbi:MAG: hypothetical protein NC336_10230 [Clostridium sp.]|nr:hypothetical protein [Clostridium sp.]
MKEYDEQDAIAAITEYIGGRLPDGVTDDTIYEIIDLMFDFFEQENEDEDSLFDLFDIDQNGRVVRDGVLDPLYDYVARELNRSMPFGTGLAPEMIRDIVDGELLYELSLEQ